jgi:hypothetical protein
VRKPRHSGILHNVQVQTRCESPWCGGRLFKLGLWVVASPLTKKSWALSTICSWYMNHLTGIEQHKKCDFNPWNLKVLAKKGTVQLKLEDHSGTCDNSEGWLISVMLYQKKPVLEPVIVDSNSSSEAESMLKSTPSKA